MRRQCVDSLGGGPRDGAAAALAPRVLGRPPAAGRRDAGRVRPLRRVRSPRRRRGQGRARLRLPPTQPHRLQRDRRRGLRPARPQAGAASAAAARGRWRGSKAAPEVTHGLKGLNALLVIVSRLLLMLTSSLLWSTSENILRLMPQGDPTCKLCRVAHTQRGKDTRRDTVFPKRKAREVVKSRSYFFTHTMKVVRQVGNPLATPRRLRLPTGAARPLAELSA